MKIEIFDNTDGALVQILEWSGTAFHEGVAQGLLKAVIPSAWESPPQDGFTVYVSFDEKRWDMSKSGDGNTYEPGA